MSKHAGIDENMNINYEIEPCKPEMDENEDDLKPSERIITPPDVIEISEDMDVCLACSCSVVSNRNCLLWVQQVRK